MIRNKRIGSIDALRGFAAILVLVIHVSESYSRIDTIGIHSEGWMNFLSYIDLGRIGISIFFIISGFVIVKSVKGQGFFAVKNFLIKRFFRLYPLFWLSAFLGIYCLWVLNGRAVSTALLLGNLTMIPALLGQEMIMGLYWSLETELVFYLIVVIIFLFGRLYESSTYIALMIGMYIVLGCFIVFPQIGPKLPHWLASPYHLSLMFWGALFRNWYEESLSAKGTQKEGFFFCFGSILIFLVPVSVIGKHLYVGDPLNFPDAIAYIIGILLFSFVTLFTNVNNKLLLWLGTISYSMYLLHPIVFWYLKHMMIKEGKVYSMHVGYYVILNIVLTIILSSITYTLLEKPMNAKAKKMVS